MPPRRSIRRNFARRQESAPVHPDFLDWATDVPDSYNAAPAPQAWPSPAPPPPAQHWQPATPAPASRPAAWAEPPAQEPPPPPPRMPVAPPASDNAYDWARGTEQPAPSPEPVPPTPTPRRPAVWVSSEPAGPWSGPDRAAAAAAGRPCRARRRQHRRQPRGPGRRTFTRCRPAAPPPRRRCRGVHASVRPRCGGARAAVCGSGPGPTRPNSFGQLMRIVVENLRQLLQARLQAKRLARTPNQTMVQAIDNNPLKFSPTRRGCAANHVRAADPQLSRCAADPRAELRGPQIASDQDLRRDAAGPAHAACRPRSAGDRVESIPIAALPRRRLTQGAALGYLSDALAEPRPRATKGE